MTWAECVLSVLVPLCLALWVLYLHASWSAWRWKRKARRLRDSLPHAETLPYPGPCSTARSADFIAQELLKTETVTKVTLGEKDVLILRTATVLSDKALDRLTENLQSVFGSERRVVILEDGLTVHIMTVEKPENKEGGPE